MDYKIEKSGSTVTIIDTATGIGLQFKEGESLQRYTTALYLPDISMTHTENGLNRVSEISQRLESYAAEHYPKEFKEIR